MEQPGDWVLDELNKRVVAESLIEKSRAGRVTRHSYGARVTVTRARSPFIPANVLVEGLAASSAKQYSFLVRN
jgi:hypothetical protein